MSDLTEDGKACFELLVQQLTAPQTTSTEVDVLIGVLCSIARQVWLKTATDNLLRFAFELCFNAQQLPDLSHRQLPSL